MAPAQRTFTIVPNPLGMQGLVQRPAGEGVPSHRPMTSKQAQKLHRQATKLPKRTKAQQAEYERDQKRRIKEEDEKQRASNKARMLRERKKEKEQKIIDAKKRKGLPVVDVRPSQDLITRFVRGNGTGKKRCVSGALVRLDTLREESPAFDSATETDEDVYHPVEEEAKESDNTVEAPQTRAEPSSALPTSTQLFVLSHLEDILPSPSQELRELDDIPPRGPPTSRPQPPLWKPPPRFPARGVQTGYSQKPPLLPQHMAPRPRQPTTAAPRVHQIHQTVEPALPFFSTQDFMLSSQDIRDLEDTTETPSKLPRKETHTETSHAAAIPQWSETPSKAEQLPVDAFIYPWKSKLAGKDFAETAVRHPTSIKELRNCSQSSHASRYALRKSQPRTPACSSNLSAKPSQFSKPRSQSSSLDPVRSNPSLAHVAAASQRSRSSPRAQSCNIPVAKTASQDPAPPKPSASAPKGRISPANNWQSQQAGDITLPTDKDEAHIAGDSPKPETPKPSAPPQKGRFFTASNEAIQLAMEKSMRTHKEEQRKREAEQRALELLRQKIADEEVRHTEDEHEEDGEEGEEEMIKKALRQWEAEEHESDVLADWINEHQHDADRQVSQDARDAADDNAFDLDDDVEQELLGAEYALVCIQPPAPVPSGRGTCGLVREQTACVASQETDYGDLDVTVEDLDDYL